MTEADTFSTNNFLFSESSAMLGNWGMINWTHTSASCKSAKKCLGCVLLKNALQMEPWQDIVVIDTQTTSHAPSPKHRCRAVAGVFTSSIIQSWQVLAEILHMKLPWSSSFPSSSATKYTLPFPLLYPLSWASLGFPTHSIAVLSFLWQVCVWWECKGRKIVKAFPWYHNFH